MKNAGYTVCKRADIGEMGVALAHNADAVQQWVTWLYRTNAPNDFFWGHYFFDAIEAHDNYMARIRLECGRVSGKELRGLPGIEPRPRLVNLSVKSLYLQYGTRLASPLGALQIMVRTEKENFWGEAHTNIYYDLLDDRGQLLCMDGEQVEVIRQDEKGNVLLRSFMGETDMEFWLMPQAFRVATYQ